MRMHERACGRCLLGNVGVAALVGGSPSLHDDAARRRLPERRAYVWTDACASDRMQFDLTHWPMHMPMHMQLRTGECRHACHHVVYVVDVFPA